MIHVFTIQAEKRLAHLAADYADDLALPNSGLEYAGSGRWAFSALANDNGPDPDAIRRFREALAELAETNREDPGPDVRSYFFPEGHPLEGCELRSVRPWNRPEVRPIAWTETTVPETWGAFPLLWINGL